METLKELSTELIHKLSDQYDPREAESIGTLVFEHCTGLNKSQQILQRDRILTPEIKVQINKILQKLLQNVPIQYILGKTSFYELELELEPGVLIPRPETEELVIWAGESLSSVNPAIVDVGTGSGCIALSLKHRFPRGKVLATDISGPALQLAARNAEQLGLPIALENADIFTPDEWPGGTFDLVISNPPYIPEGEKPKLSPHITEQEPGEALFVPDNDPLIFYRALAQFSRACLRPGALLMAEFHSPFARDLKELWQSFGFTKITIRKDLHGRERMIRAVKP